MCDFLALGVARGIWCAESGPAGCGVTCRTVHVVFESSWSLPSLPTVSPPPPPPTPPLSPSLPPPPLHFTLWHHSRLQLQSSRSQRNQCWSLVLLGGGEVGWEWGLFCGVIFVVVVCCFCVCLFGGGTGRSPASVRRYSRNWVRFCVTVFLRPLHGSGFDTLLLKATLRSGSEHNELLLLPCSCS